MTARTAAPPHKGQEHGLMAFLIFFMICFLMWIYQPPIMYGSCWVIYQLWSLCDFPRTHSYVAERLNLLAWAANRVNDLSWSEFINVMNKTAGILLVPLSVIVVGSMVAVRNHASNRTRRDINVYSLPIIMSQFSPNIVPALCYGDKETQLLNCDPPEHRSAQSPEEFAKQHQLVIGERLDHERARIVFEQQLGTPLNDASSFNPHERALVAAFGLQAFLKDRKGAEKLLDSLNRSCLIKSRRDKGKKGYPILGLATNAFERVINTPEAKVWIGRHSTTRTALFALHDQDLRLPGPRFRWLKGLDRTLWYALTSTGRPKVFVEGAGVIAVSKWETLIGTVSERLKVTIPIPVSRMDKAIYGLEIDLRGVGLTLEERTATEPTESAPDADLEEDMGDVVVLRNQETVIPTATIVTTPSSEQQPVKTRTFTRPRTQRPS
uniref:secretion/conjugation apparatus DotM-related subunit n=2 Tax=Serratia TaxID=613 RepID=UPI001F4BEF12|nr:conjugal transfer protein TrbA [Serratia proteamaculans]ULG17466.1 TrbA [Serratia proteamaculans]